MSSKTKENLKPSANDNEHMWADYMVAVNWMHNNIDVDSKNRWIATYAGKKWIEKIFS
jgi:hypothetical protein